MSSRRYVFGTNTVVSAFLFGRSMPGQALETARRRGRLLLSDETARELNEVLEREKFDEYVRRETRREFVVALVEEASFVEPNEQIERCRDPDDDKFLELAAAGNATAIGPVGLGNVSGHPHSDGEGISAERRMRRGLITRVLSTTYRISFPPHGD